MKNLLFLIILSSFLFTGFTQNRAIIPTEWQNHAEKRIETHKISSEINPDVIPLKASTMLEETIGSTWYDLQNNGSMQNRLHVFADGTMGAVFSYMDEPTNWHTGTGYKYFDGSTWGSFLTEPLEEYSSGWPAYDPFGENGEIIVSHIQDSQAEGLTFSKRENKGEGDWEQWIFQGPGGFEEIRFPHMATGGVNNSTIHLLATTYPFSPYQGQEMALLYSRSTDGGVTWNPENQVLPGINANFYAGFDADNYDIRAEGDNVAILIGGPWVDLLLLKSNNGGESWDKTIIWENPYPLFNTSEPVPTDSFYCVDGSHNLDFDNEGMVHVVFGINRTYADYDGTFWFPAVGGIGYWNENRPFFSNDLNALNPYYHPDSELEDGYNLIGWTQDLNGNDTLDILDDWGIYYLGFSSMPQIYIDDMDQLYVVYSSVTEFYDNGNQSYRHLWARTSPNGEWWGSFEHLTSELFHIFDECVFPSLTYCKEESSPPFLSLDVKLLYQYDTEPGMAIRGDEDPFGENFISYMGSHNYTDVYELNRHSNVLETSQNHPNPFNDKTNIQLKLMEPGIFNLEVTNLTGKKVYENNLGYLNTGTHNVSLEVPMLSPGVYFYSVKDQEHSVTKKMIVK